MAGKAWLDTSKFQALKSFSAMPISASEIEQLASVAAERHVAGQVRSALQADPAYASVASAVGVHKFGEQLGVGAPGPANELLKDFDIGTETRPPTGALMRAVNTGRAAAQSEVQKAVLGRLKK